MKKHLLYIGHQFHTTTKSNIFLMEMFRQEYEIEFLYIDPQDGETFQRMSELHRGYYDLVVSWQIMISIRDLNRFIQFGRGVLFPMYDYYIGGVPIQNPLWAEYWNFKIICFCKTMYTELKSFGFDAAYIQYFPKPAKKLKYGNPRSVFFWQRIAKINPDMVAKLLKNFDYTSIHFHKAFDPKEKQMEATVEMYPGKSLTFSTWYETRERMLEDMKKSAVYVAPRHLEGIGMSFLEAMAHGRCVIAVNKPTMNEYIVNGQTGLLYNPEENPAPLVPTEDIRTIQKAAYEYIRKGYSEWEKNKGIIREWMVGKSAPDRELLEQTAQEKGWGALLPYFSLKAGLRRFLPDALWNRVSKFFGFEISWQPIEKIYLFGFIYCGCVKYGNNRTLFRVEFCGFPVYEKNEEKFGWN